MWEKFKSTVAAMLRANVLPILGRRFVTEVTQLISVPQSYEAAEKVTTYEKWNSKQEKARRRGMRAASVAVNKILAKAFPQGGQQ